MLASRDQTYNADDSSKYIKFMPDSAGLTAQLNFQPPASEVADATGSALTVNYRGRLKTDQTRRLDIYDYSAGRWITIGDNQDAEEWLWSELTFDIPGTLSNYVQDGQMTVSYRTESDLDSSYLDYVALNINQSTATSNPGALSGQAHTN